MRVYLDRAAINKQRISRIKLTGCSQRVSLAQYPSRVAPTQKVRGSIFRGQKILFFFKDLRREYFQKLIRTSEKEKVELRFFRLG